MTVLFISDPTNDGHLLPVLTELGRRGIAVQVFNPGAFPQEARITVDSAPSGPRAYISWEEQEIDLSTIGSIWYRRPGNFNLSPDLLPKEDEWLRAECSALINGIYANTDALWVSEPYLLRRADVKLLQLRVAQDLGFRVPDYIVTNDPERARSFLAGHPDGVIVKGLLMPTILLDDQAGMIYTHRVTSEDIEQLDSVRHGPTFLQALVPKARDIRVTVIGDEVFPAAIESMRVADARIDFRRAEIMDIPHQPIALPEAVETACREIVKRLGLRFGAIDLLETPEGDYVFLENTPNGQWYWVEMMTGQPMARAMADLLERGERARGFEPNPASAITVPDRGPRVLAVGQQTVAMPARMNANGRHDGLTATRAWLELKQGQILLHVGDMDEGAKDQS
jgi:glutathione synthase/RimK-type ligase-like ATP-grasp enzyme